MLSAYVALAGLFQICHNIEVNNFIILLFVLPYMLELHKYGRYSSTANQSAMSLLGASLLFAKDVLVSNVGVE